MKNKIYSLKNLAKILQREKKKSKIIVHDPKAISNTKEIFLKKITYCEKLEDVFKLSDCAVLMTPWDDYKKISSKLIKKLQSKLFIDTRRILKLHDKEIILSIK